MKSLLTRIAAKIGWYCDKHNRWRVPMKCWEHGYMGNDGVELCGGTCYRWFCPICDADEF